MLIKTPLGVVVLLIHGGVVLGVGVIVGVIVGVTV
jgi:hypothetical protein